MKTRFAFLVVCMLFQNSAIARDYLDLSADIRKLPTAVPYFINKRDGGIEDLGRKLSDLMSASLEFHGFLSAIDPARYDGRQDMDWTSLGAELVVLGQYEVNGEEIVLELRLIDVLNGQMMTGKRYRGKREDSKLMIFKFCDEVIDKLTGEPGVALSLIAFVSDSTGEKEIYLTDIVGEQIRQVTRHRNLTVSPRFTADARHLAYTSYHGGNPNLYLTELSTKT